MRLLIVLFAVFCGGAYAASIDSKSAQRGWRFERVVDKMTDKVSCRLNSPLGAPVAFSLQGWTLYLVADKRAALYDGARLTVRVDKGDAIAIPMRVVTLGLGSADWNAFTADWFDQMSKGRTVLYRVVSTIGGAEGEIDLASFPAARAGYDACMAALP